jgi:predicted nucleotidyltransferase
MDYEFVNKNTLKILNVLLEGRLYFNQIYEKTKITSKNNLLKSLNILEENNIIIKEKNKSNTFYEINFNNLISVSMLNLINKIKFEQLPFPVKKSILEIIEEVKPKIAILFGSYSKLNYSKESDIDLLFVEGSDKKGIIDEKSSKYGVETNIISIKLKDFNKSNDQIAHILKTGYPLVGENYFYDEYKKI